MHDAVRIAPKPQPKIQVPSAATPRTYRPDLNPVSTPGGKPVAPRTGEPADTRRSEPRTDADLRLDVTISEENPFASPDAPVQNTSGTRDGEVPEEIKKWNWAAFLMPAVWGLFSGVPYTAILFGAALLPPLAQLLVMGTASVYLGIKGNELAWRGKKWRSVEHFSAFQKQWVSWSVKLTIAVAVILLFYMMATGGS